MRKTKIIATIGPSSRKPEIIKNLIEAGVNIFRLNFSHGDHEYHKKNIEIIRIAAKESGKIVGILQDLSGPKVRIGEVKNPIFLHEGEILEIYKEPIMCEKKNSVAKIYIDYPQILEDLKIGDLIYIADGAIRVRVIEKHPSKVITQVIIGGIISSRKGVNFPGAEISISTLTSKDKIDLEFGIKHGVDFVALSFVKDEKDVEECKKIIKKLKGNQWVFAKIETQKAVENIDKILNISDGIMIARGDLGVEVPIEKVPIIQKEIVKKAKDKGLPVIIATQMLTSMINSIMPTRADVSDIANAVLDGADALMLSDETAVGKYPVQSVKMMVKIIKEAEKIYNYEIETHPHVSSDYAIAYSSVILAKDIRANKIIVFTKSGSSAKRVSRFRPASLILANVHDEDILRKLTILWGVYPYTVLSENQEPENMVKEFVKRAYRDKIIKENETLVLTMGYPVGKVGSTNLIRILKQEQIKEIIGL